jgi:hypothetical protein
MAASQRAAHCASRNIQNNNLQSALKACFVLQEVNVGGCQLMPSDTPAAGAVAKDPALPNLHAASACGHDVLGGSVRC